MTIELVIKQLKNLTKFYILNKLTIHLSNFKNKNITLLIIDKIDKIEFRYSGKNCH